MIRIKRFLSIFLIIVLFIPVRAQSYSNQQIVLAERLHSLAKNASPELAYIQTSKDIYETGEDLWFKVYLLDAQYLIPSLLSKTLYLQLLNETSKKAVWQEKYEIQDGFANGRVYLENALPEGDYLLAAYTANSFYNDTSEFYAVRRIKVKTDISSQPLINMDVPLKQNSIQFTTFPEGGNLVSGIQSKLAFKAVNSNGEPVDIIGTLFEGNTPLLEFKSTHAGMGSIGFTPDAGKRYLIRLTEPAIDSSYLLPEIYITGITLQLVGRDKESLSFRVSQSPGLKQEDIYLRVQCRGVVYGMATGNLNRELMIKLPLAGLPQGIAEVTLFNSNLVPVAERLVYINQDRKLNIATELSKEIYPTRGKVALKITVKDEKGQPVAANLGVSVFDKLYQNPMDSNNILTHFYLSTQLKGRIYNPSYYFNSSSKGRDEALDLLMLTQGWRKYVWNETNLKKIEESRQQVILDGTKGSLIAHSIWKNRRNEKLFVIAYCPDKDKKKVLMQVGTTGGFIVSPDLLKRWEGDFIYLKPLWKHNYPPSIKLTNPFETINLVMKGKEVLFPVQGLMISKEGTPDLSSYNEMIRIPEVIIKGRKTNPLRGKYMAKLDNLAKFDMNTDFVCEDGILNCQDHGKDAAFNATPIEGVMYLRVVDYHTPQEHFRLITYFPPKWSEDWLLKMNNLSVVKAYYGNRKFYQPNYDKETENALIPDFRNTLLWEPSVITDEKGEASLSFYCSDINTDFIGRIEGVGGEGLLGNGDFKFTVRKVRFTP